MTDESKQSVSEETGRALAEELTVVLRKMTDLDGFGEKSMRQAMSSLDDAQRLFDKLCAIDFGYGGLVESMIPSYFLRSRPSEEYPKGEIDENMALAMLLVNEIIFTNEYHWQKTWPKEAQEATYLGVNCNDVFAWGCADAEEMRHDQITEVFEYWEKDPVWGSAIWCMIQRKQLAQGPVIAKIRKAGIWNIDELTTEHGLKVNYYDGISMALAKRKREVYVAWCEEQGTEPLPFDGGWWKGWQEYVSAHPEWNNDEWKAADKVARNEWLIANGWSEPAASEQTETES